MTYTARQYAQALVELCQNSSVEESRQIVNRLQTLLLRNGKGSLFRPILQMIATITDQDQYSYHVALTLSSKQKEQAKPLEEVIRVALGPGGKIDISHDDTIIAGVRILLDSQWYIDATLNHRIDTLYRKLTA